MILIMSTLAGAVTLQYDDFEEGGLWGHAAMNAEAVAVWYDLDSLGIENFMVDSVEIAFCNPYVWSFNSFYVEFWTPNYTGCQPDSLIWTSNPVWFYALEAPPAPNLQKFEVNCPIPLNGDVWACFIPCFTGPGAPCIVAQVTGYHHGFLIREDDDDYSTHSGDPVIRLIGEESSALEQSTWGSIKSSW